VAAALRSFDEIYRQPTDTSPLAEVVERLAAAAPRDIADIDLKHYRGLQPSWNDWQHVVTRGRHWAQVVASTQDPRVKNGLGPWLNAATDMNWVLTRRTVQARSPFCHLHSITARWCIF